MNRFLTASVAIGLYLSQCGEALAYLDLGSGSLLIQFILAGFFGVLLYLKLGWSKVRRFFHRGWQQLKSVLTGTAPGAGHHND